MENLEKELDSWLKTPFKHAGKSKQGIDCMNFVLKMCQFMGVLPEKIHVPEYSTHWFHHTREFLFESAVKIIEGYGLKKYEIYSNREEIQDGDIVLIRWKENLAISHGGVACNNHIYHASANGVEKNTISSLQEKIKFVIRFIMLFLLFFSPFLDMFFPIPIQEDTVKSYEIVAIVIVAIVAVVSAVLAFTYQPTSGKIKSSMEANTLDRFQITTVSEGVVVPIIFGTFRVNTNIIDFRNLTTQAITEKVKTGGKGGKSKSQTVEKGYHYAMDVHHGICQTPFGKADLIATFIADKSEAIYAPAWMAGGKAREITWNDGTNNVFPTWSPNINRIKNICSLGIQGWYLGENVNTVPILHVVVKYTSSTGILYENMSNGTNPAAAIYIILRIAGIPEIRINKATFDEAATYWNEKGFGINTVFNGKMKASEAISKILSMVDGIIYKDASGKFCIKPISPNDSPVAEIQQEEINGLSVARKTWDQLPNKFKATFIDPAQSYTQRTLIAENPGAIELAGKENTYSLDLTFFNDASAAAKRLDEIMKRESYPHLEIKFKASLKYSILKVGDIFTLSYPDYGILSAYFRVSTIEHPTIDSNELSVSAIQVAERIFDSHFFVQGGTEWTKYNPLPMLLSKVDALELPYNSETKTVPSVCFLMSRENGVEEGVYVYVSDAIAGTYNLVGSISNWAVYGITTNEYNATTLCDNSEIGINFNAYRKYTYFDNLTRQEMWNSRRIAKIGNEIIIFQNYEEQENGSITISKIVRGVFATPRENHPIGSEIWITTIEPVEMNSPTIFYKLVPYSGYGQVDLSDISAKSLVFSGKATKPYPPQVHAKRTGSVVEFQIFPRTPSVLGFGIENTDKAWMPAPFPFEGYFILEIGSSSFVYYVDNFSYSSAGSFTANIKHVWNGNYSTDVVIFVDVEDGIYKG